MKPLKTLDFGRDLERNFKYYPQDLFGNIYNSKINHFWIKSHILASKLKTEASSKLNENPFFNRR
jgi:hypothetical protein